MTKESFRHLGASEAVCNALAARGIVSPFPIQALVMADALAGIDVMAKSRTGSGKTLGFAIPIVEQIEPQDATPSALILVPTRELCAQVGEEIEDIAKARGLRVGVAYGGVRITEQATGVKGAHILVATPGRLEDLAGRKQVRLETVRILVLDEADRMLDMGFLPQVNDIVKRLPAERQTMFFSATLDGEVGRIASAWTRNPAKHEVEAPRETVEEVTHRFIPVAPQQRADRLARLLAEEVDRGLALVFVRTKRGADGLTQQLKQRDVAVAAMHGDMTQQAREKTLGRFESGACKVLVATDVAARGLDLDDITHVVNYDPPEDAKGYVHRVGRTARAGRSGTAITFVLPDQRGEVSRIVRQLDLHAEFEAEGMKVAPPATVYRGGKGIFSRRRRR